MKTRVLTGFILLFFAIYVIWFTSNYFFLSASTFMMIIAAWEWAGIVNLKAYWKRIIYLILFMMILGLLYFQFIPYIPWLWLNSLVACWIIFVICKYNSNSKSFCIRHTWIKRVLGLLLLSSTWLSLNLLRFPPFSPNWLFFALVIIWSTDTGAYFTGKHWGKRKLAPNVSPNKTWEGLFGGIFSALIVSVVILYAFTMPLKSILLSRLLTVIVLVSILSVVGDLFESILKREAAVKDSGSLLPGHGGLLDRIDGLLFALPLYALLSLYLR